MVSLGWIIIFMLNSCLHKIEFGGGVRGWGGGSDGSKYRPAQNTILFTIRMRRMKLEI